MDDQYIALPLPCTIRNTIRFMNAQSLFNTFKPWLCTLITHVVVMPVHGDCIATNAFTYVPGVSVQVEHVVDS